MTNELNTANQTVDMAEVVSQFNGTKMTVNIFVLFFDFSSADVSPFRRTELGIRSNINYLSREPFQTRKHPCLEYYSSSDVS